MKSPKQRSNYKPGLCMKSNCENRGKECKNCRHFDKYVVEQPENPVDPDNLGAVG